jgi:hypothetical protein
MTTRLKCGPYIHSRRPSRTCALAAIRRSRLGRITSLSYRLAPRKIAGTGTRRAGNIVGDADPAAADSECTPDDREPSAVPGCDVESDRSRWDGRVLEVAQSEAPQTGLLLLSDRFRRRSEPLGGAGLHLHEHDEPGAASDSDEVDLALGASPVAVDDPIAAPAIPAGCCVLGSTAERQPLEGHVVSVAAMCDSGRLGRNVGLNELVSTGRPF